MTQLIRMLVAYTCLVLVMAFVALWVASYFWLSIISYTSKSEERFAVSSERGQLQWTWSRWIPGVVAYPIYWRVMPIEDNERFMKLHRGVWPPEPSLIGFATRRDDRTFQVVTPHWFPILLIGAIGFIAKPRPKLKLSIRDLLIITTILAVLLTIGLRDSQGPQDLQVPPGARLRTVEWETKVIDTQSKLAPLRCACVAANRRR
jgi:hypothetical protein